MGSFKQYSNAALSFPNPSASQKLVPVVIQKTLCYAADFLNLFSP